MNLPEIEVREAIIMPYQSIFRYRSIEKEAISSTSKYGAIIPDTYLSKDCIRDTYAGIPSARISMLTIRKNTYTKSTNTTRTNSITIIIERKRGILSLSIRESNGLTRTKIKNAMTIGRIKSAQTLRINRNSTIAMNARIFLLCLFNVSCGPGFMA